MTTQIIDTSQIRFNRRKVVLDTNIWIMIQGFDLYAPAKKVNAYSSAYKTLLVRENTIVINEYIIGEFCHVCAALEYESLRTSDPNIPRFKRYRRLPEFRITLEGIRDTALHILDDCEFIPTNGKHYSATDLVQQFCEGILDFTDLVISEFCIKENFLLMSDDRDFWGQLDVITYEAPKK